MIAPFVFLILAMVFLIIYFTVDGIITRKRLVINQEEWDEYSKDMTESEKTDCFLDFVKNNRIKHGWPFLYIPRM